MILRPYTGPSRRPFIRNGKFSAGPDFQCGENVVIDVAEEVVIGARCVLPDSAYLSGRSAKIGDDFYGYSWEFSRLDVGRGRIDEEHAVLTVGDRCTLHNNRIDLASRVVIRDDVGLSPDVAIYTHGYWLSALDGYPRHNDRVAIGDGSIIGFRSVLLPGSTVALGCVIGAQSVVYGDLTEERSVYAGNPARRVRGIVPLATSEREQLLVRMMSEYARSCEYRCLVCTYQLGYPVIEFAGCRFDVVSLTVEGEENPATDDLRDFLFRYGIRFYTQRPFRKLRRIR